MQRAMSRLQVALHAVSADAPVVLVVEGKRCVLMMSGEGAVAKVVRVVEGVLARTKTSSAPLVSPGTRLVARL
jgi:hypothetical protein